jgi:general secretion pathway protein C
MNHNRRMPARLSAFVIWALVAVSIAYWGLRLFVKPPVAPLHTQLASDSGPARVDLTRLLGAPPATVATSVQAPAISSRFQLTGVMAPKVPGQQGIALIAVDGKMPRAYRVGAAVDGDFVLQAVSLRTASIGPTRGAPAVVLEIPILPAPATGSLPPASSLIPPTSGAVPPLAAAPMPVAPVAPPTPAATAGAQGDQAQPGRAARRARGMGQTPREQTQDQPQPPQPSQPGSTQ